MEQGVWGGRAPLEGACPPWSVIAGEDHGRMPGLFHAKDLPDCKKGTAPGQPGAG